MASFLASFTAMLPLFGNGLDSDQDMAVLLGDMRWWALLTLSIAFLLTVSSGLNQAAKILDLHRGRPHPVGRRGPARLADGDPPPRCSSRWSSPPMPAWPDCILQFPFTGPLITQRPDMLITLLATLVAGIGLVFAVQECCSPLQTRLLCEQQRSTD